MAVVITRTADPVGVASVSSVVTYSSQSIGSAVADRLVVLCVACEDFLGGSTISATADWGLGDTAFSASSAEAQFNLVKTRIFVWAIGGSATTATFKVTYQGDVSATTNHIAVYKVTGALGALNSSGTNTSTDMDASAPLTTGSTTIPSGGGMIAVASCGTDTVGKTWANLTADLDEDAGTFRFTVATSTSAGTATRTCTGSTNQEDGALSWVIFDANVSADISPANKNLGLSPTAPTNILAVAGLPARKDVAISTTAPDPGRGLNPARRDLVFTTVAVAQTREKDLNTVDLGLSVVRPDVTVGGAVSLSPARTDLFFQRTAPLIDVPFQVLPAGNIVISRTAPAQTFEKNLNTVNVAFSTTAPSLGNPASPNVIPSTFNLALSGSQPAVGMNKPLNAADAVISRTAPTVAVSSVNAGANPSRVDLVITPWDSPWTLEKDLNTVDLAISRTAPTRILFVAGDPPRCDIVISSQQPDVAAVAAGTISPPWRDLGISVTAPTTVFDLALNPSSRDIVISSTAPAVAAQRSMVPTWKDLAISRTAPGVFLGAFSGSVAFVPAAVDVILSVSNPTLRQPLTAIDTATYSPHPVNCMLEGQINASRIKRIEREVSPGGKATATRRFGKVSAMVSMTGKEPSYTSKTSTRLYD